MSIRQKIGLRAEPGEELVEFPEVETHIVSSRFVDQTYKIQVARPPRKRSETVPLPVVYVTDANIVFEMFKSITWMMQLLDPDPIKFILVGIGYPSDQQFSGIRLRARDFTFPRYPNTEYANLPPWEGLLVPAEGSKAFYGADDFQNFIEHELIPLVDGTYETLSEDRTYFGHSGGGGFGLYTLLNKPWLFKNYIVSSPGLSFDGEIETPDGMVRYENYDFAMDEVRDFVKSGRLLPGNKLYMSVGTEEEHEPVISSCQLTSSFYRMIALLKTLSIPNLEIMPEVFSGETHQTVWPMAYMHGIQAVFGRRQIPKVY